MLKTHSNARIYLLNEIEINYNGINFLIGLNEAKEGRLNSNGVQIEKGIKGKSQSNLF